MWNCVEDFFYGAVEQLWPHHCVWVHVMCGESLEENDDSSSQLYPCLKLLDSLACLSASEVCGAVNDVNCPLSWELETHHNDKYIHSSDGQK